MSNDLVTTGGYASLAEIPEGSNPFLEAAGRLGSGGFTHYMRFNGDKGEYTYGQDSTEFELGTRLIADVAHMELGWQAWNDGTVIDEVFVPVMDGQPPAKGRLAKHEFDDPDDGDGWKKAGKLVFRDPTTGEQYEFKTYSAGGNIALGNLLTLFGKHFRLQAGKLPLIELEAKQFPVKGKKKVFKFAPVFNIVDWIPEADLIDLFAAADARAADNDDDDDDDDGDYDETETPAVVEPPKRASRKTAAPKKAAPVSTPEETVVEDEDEDDGGEAEETPAPARRGGRRSKSF